MYNILFSIDTEPPIGKELYIFQVNAKKKVWDDTHQIDTTCEEARIGIVIKDTLTYISIFMRMHLLYD